MPGAVVPPRPPGAEHARVSGGEAAREAARRDARVKRHPWSSSCPTRETVPPAAFCTARTPYPPPGIGSSRMVGAGHSAAVRRGPQPPASRGRARLRRPVPPRPGSASSWRSAGGCGIGVRNDAHTAEPPVGRPDPARRCPAEADAPDLIPDVRSKAYVRRNLRRDRWATRIVRPVCA